MAQDGTGGLVYRKRVGRARARLRRAARGRRAGRRRSASTSARASTPPGRASAPATAAGWSSPGCRSSASAPTGCSRPSLDPGARRFQAPMPVDLNVGEATATYPSLAMNAAAAPTSPTACCRHGAARPERRRRATSRPRRASRATTARSGRCWASRPTATRPRRSRLPTAANSPQVGHRRDRQRDRRLPGARRRLRRPRLGAAAVRRDARHPAARQPAGARRQPAARAGRRASRST